jgi:hypothetical protein
MAGPSNGVFAVSLSSAPSAATTVTFALSGTASTSDYSVSPSSSTVSFSTGQTSAATVTITPNRSGGPNGTDSVVLTLMTGSLDLNTFIGAPSVATVSIADAVFVSVVATKPNASQAGELGDVVVGGSECLTLTFS